ncbi:hypothetical protein QL285_059421 [Trifolium repens]|nr:hypothetical protein QL285_059421 [Trifolium repens]
MGQSTLIRDWKLVSRGVLLGSGRESRLTEPELKLGETNRSSLISFLSFRLKIQTGFCQGWDAHVGYNSLFKLFKALKFYPCRSICSTAVKQAKSHKVREI